jgi:hypothetical protein
MPKPKMILMAIILCLTASVKAAAQEDDLNKYVYMVRIPATNHHNKTAIQTGFRLAGRKGIITALHGVADGTTFNAYNENGDVLNNLKIASVDIDNDVALLRSEELENRPAEGLQAVGNLTIKPGDALRVAGHPDGINLYIKDDPKAGTPVFKELHMLISPDSANAFDRRQSPKTDITILNISSGNLGPGFSGAPVLNSSNQVVAIIDGGLREGALAISWAIPIKKVNWRDMSSARTLVNRLAKLDTTNLFSFTPYNIGTGDSPTSEETMTSAEGARSSTREANVTQTNINIGASLKRIVASSPNGFTDLLGEQDSRNNSYKSKVSLPGAIETIVTPHHSVQAWMYNTERMADAEGYYNSLVEQLKLAFPTWDHREANPYKQAPIKSFVSTSPNGRTYIST